MFVLVMTQIFVTWERDASAMLWVWHVARGARSETVDSMGVKRRSAKMRRSAFFAKNKGRRWGSLGGEHHHHSVGSEKGWIGDTFQR